MPSSISGHGWEEHSTVKSISGHGWEEHTTVKSLRGVVMPDAQQDQPFYRTTSQQVRVAAADEMLNWFDYEAQVCGCKLVIPLGPDES